MSWLEKLLPAKIQQTTPSERHQQIPEGLWIKCPSCESVLYKADLEKNQNVCPTCGHHHRIGARARLNHFLDAEGRYEIGQEVIPVDALKFQDSRKYPQRLKEALENTGETDALIVMGGAVKGIELVVACLEFGFMGGSMGLAVGEGQEAMFATLDFAPDMLPTDRPRYLMGVGKPDDLVGAVERGVDMFDCVLPSRSGRNGQGFTWNGPVNLRNARHAEDSAPLDERCPCDACTSYSRAYLHHLIKSGEILGAMLLTEHNLTFYQQLMAGMRDAIAERRFAEFAAGFRRAYLA